MRQVRLPGRVARAATSSGGDLGILQVTYELASGTAGGTATSGSWEKAPLNTTVLNTITGASFSDANDRITLATAGTYDFEAYGSFFYCNGARLKIFNFSDTADVVIGLNHSVQAALATADTQWAYVKGRVTITGSKDFEVHTRVQTTRATDGRGVATSFTVNEKFTELIVRRVA